MALTVRGALMRAAMKLHEESFRIVQLHVKDWNYFQASQHARPHIQRACELVLHMWRMFGEHQAVEKFIAALEHTNQSHIRQELREDLKRVRNHFVDKIQSQVIRWTMMVDPVLDDLRGHSLLTEEDYLSLKMKQSSWEKMMGLLVISRSWKDPNMNRVYNVLRRHNVEVMKALEMSVKMQKYSPRGVSHFMDEHYTCLEHNIDEVNPVLDDLLRQDRLTKEQYEDLKSKLSPQDTMKGLYEIACAWNGAEKDFFYLTLRKYNYSVFRNCERCPEYTDHIVDVFRSFLIRKIHRVDSVLHDLLQQKLLTREQCSDLEKISSSTEKMRKLFGMVTFWSNHQKDELYVALRKHNYPAIRHIERQLGRDHIIDAHRSDLIRMVSCVDSVLDDLRSQTVSQEEYNVLRRMSRSDEKMRGLFEVVDKKMYVSFKDLLYQSLRKHNPEVIRCLEKSWTDDHFMNVYKSDLINRITVVDPVLKDLLEQNILTLKQFDELMRGASSEYKMRELCEMINSWNNIRRDIFYLTLKRHNRLIVDHIERSWRLQEHNCDHFVDTHYLDLVTEVTEVDPVLRDLHKKGILTQKQYDDLRKLQSSIKKMEELYEIIKSCDDLVKDLFYWSVKKHNDRIENLERTWRGDTFDAHYVDLVREITEVDPVLRDLHEKEVLTQKQYDDLRKLQSSRMKLEELYEMIKSSDDRTKHAVFSSLQHRNRHLMEKIKARWSRVDFVNAHLTALVTQITVVDPVVKELQQRKILTPEQYMGLMDKTTPSENMRALYEIIKSSSDSSKEAFFWCVKKFNRSVIEDLQVKWSQATGSLLDGHTTLLKEQISLVDPVLDDLREQNILTRELYAETLGRKSSIEKIMGLYKVIQDSDIIDSDMIYLTLRRYNYTFFRCTEPAFFKFHRDRPPFAYLQTFLRDHQADLMRWVTLVDPVLEDLLQRTLLTQEEYNHICTMTTSEDKMAALFSLARRWSLVSKMTFYRCLYRYTTWLFKSLESEEDNLSTILSDLSSTKEDFLRRYQRALIRGIVSVDPVLDDLRDLGLLTPKQHSDLITKVTSEEKMRELCDLTRQWGTHDRARMLSILCKYNAEALCDLQEIEKYKRTFISGSFSSQMSKCSLEDGASLCKHCRKAEDFADVITPQITGNMYSLVLDGAGLFCCSKTGIKFQVVRPVNIVYERDSWTNHRDLTPTNQHEAIGPLFNVRSVDQPCAVSAVYLPHSLCLQDFKGDKTWIVCGHIKDGNLVLEAPDITEPYYAVLENPSFSPIGVLLNILKLIVSGLTDCTYHGMVLLYYQMIDIIACDYREHKFHVYLLRHDGAIQEEVEEDERKNEFIRLPKSTHMNVLEKKKYKVKGPENASILPQTLTFNNSRMSKPYPFSEICIKSTTSTDSTQDLILIVCPKENEASQGNEPLEEQEDDVWKANVTRGDLRRVTPIVSGEEAAAAPPETPSHFLDIFREDLIRDTKSIEPVLDKLLSSCLLTREQYDKVCSKDTDQERMRQLYHFISPWGDQHKDIVYSALKTYNWAVINKLKGGKHGGRGVISSQDGQVTWKGPRSCTLM